MGTSDIQHTIRTLVEPTLDRLGYDLVAVEWISNRAGRILRLSIDRPGGIAAADCVTVSHELSPLFDAEDPVSGAYSLEVSSPGIDRPVQRLVDFQRFSGFKAKIRLIDGFPRRRWTGALCGVEDDQVLVEVDGDRHAFHIDSIERAHLVLTLDEFQQIGLELPDAPVAGSDNHDHE